MADIAANMKDLSTRRRRRIERELRALHAMEGHLRTRDIWCAVLAIPALALLCFIVAWKLHWVSGSLALAIGAALACGAAIWWIGRRWFGLAFLIVYGLLLVAFETWPDYRDFEMLDGKERRRIKLEQAIAKREALLRSPAAPS
jgi:hypothetical protein